MNVKQNLAFPLRKRRENEKEIRDRGAEALEMVDLAASKKMPEKLSGGMRKRAAWRARSRPARLHSLRRATRASIRSPPTRSIT